MIEHARDPRAPMWVAATAALIAPWITGSSWTQALTAGITVAPVGVAWLVTRTAGPDARSLAHRFAAGWALAATAALVALLAPAWTALAAACGLAATLVVGTACGHALARLSRREGELVRLRARLARREGDVRAQADRIRRLDLIDPVSGLMNRRGFAREAERALAECADEREPLALLLIEFSPPGADRGRSTLPRPAIERRTARAVQRSVRGSDVAGQWDTAQLALLLPRCHDARPAIARLSRALAEECGDDHATRVAGVAIGPEGPWPDAEGLLAAAQAALVQARRAPRDAGVAVWPVDWGLAALTSTHPA